jgi:hypothetical protein
MKSKAIEILEGVGRRFHVRKRWLALVLLIVCLAAPRAGAVSVVDIIIQLKTITSTIQGAIGAALNGIHTLQSIVNNFRQQVIWPVAAINQTKSFVTSTRAQYGGLMSQIQSIRNNSATLTNPSQLESVVRNAQGAAIRQMQGVYSNVYGSVPSPADARGTQRNMMDMDDALAMGSLKTTVLSDGTTQGMLALADSIEQQSSTAAPGSAPMLSAEAKVANLEAQAYLAKMLAAELRQEAGKLAHQNALLKQSAASTRNLQNQFQRVLTHP